MKKNILVTGSAGFIGFYLAKKLHSLGHHVVGYDNFNDYYSPKLKRERADILHRMGIPIIEGDICDKALLMDIAGQHSITHIAHLAAQAGVRHSISQPEAYIHSNVDGFLSVLELCRHTGIKLTYASSSSVYGLNQKIPFSVEDPTDSQASLYGVTKKANELMAKTYHHLYGISATGLRFFTVYGPWGRPDMAYYSFAEAIVNSKEIKIFNNGKMERDFTYIDDIIDGTVAAINLEAPFEIFNLGHHRPEKLIYFVELLEKYLGKKGKKTYLPMQAGDVVATYADIEHSQAKLNYQPKISIEEGLKNFVDWFLNYRKQKM